MTEQPDLRRDLAALVRELLEESHRQHERERVGADELAARALDLMETHAIDGQLRPITSLVITDAADRPVGVIHLHDILRAKIV